MTTSTDLCTNWVAIADRVGMRERLEDLGVDLRTDYRQDAGGALMVRFRTSRDEWPQPSLLDRIFRSAEPMSFGKDIVPFLAPNQILVVPDQARSRAATEVGVSTVYYRHVEPGLSNTVSFDFENSQSPAITLADYANDPMTKAQLAKPFSENTTLCAHDVWQAGIHQFRALEAEAGRSGEFENDRVLADLTEDESERVGAPGVSA